MPVFKICQVAQEIIVKIISYFLYKKWFCVGELLSFNFTVKFFTNVLTRFSICEKWPSYHLAFNMSCFEMVCQPCLSISMNFCSTSMKKTWSMWKGDTRCTRWDAIKRLRLLFCLVGESLIVIGECKVFILDPWLK